MSGRVRSGPYRIPGKPAAIPLFSCPLEWKPAALPLSPAALPLSGARMPVRAATMPKKAARMAFTDSSAGEKSGSVGTHRGNAGPLTCNDAEKSGTHGLHGLQRWRKKRQRWHSKRQRRPFDLQRCRKKRHACGSGVQRCTKKGQRRRSKPGQPAMRGTTAVSGRAALLNGACTSRERSKMAGRTGAHPH